MIRHKPLWITLIAGLCIGGLVIGVKLRTKMIDKKKQVALQSGIKKSTPELIHAFMHKNYGLSRAEHEERKGVWRGKKLPAEYDIASIYSSYICAQTISQKTQHIFLAVCTNFSKILKEKPALVDFYILENNNNKLAVRAESPNNPSGLTHQQVGEIKILTLGEDFYGFSLTKSYALKGYERTVTRVFIPNPENTSLIKTLDIQTIASNKQAGQCDSGKKDYKAEWCTDISRVIIPNSSIENSPHYPITIIQKGVLKGESRNYEYSLNFDENSGRYKLPNNLALSLDF